MYFVLFVVRVCCVCVCVCVVCCVLCVVCYVLCVVCCVLCVMCCVLLWRRREVRSEGEEERSVAEKNKNPTLRMWGKIGCGSIIGRPFRPSLMGLFGPFFMGHLLTCRVAYVLPCCSSIMPPRQPIIPPRQPIMPPRQPIMPKRTSYYASQIKKK